jgi:hypothetical protein
MRVKFTEKEYQNILEGFTNELSFVRDFYFEVWKTDKKRAIELYENYNKFHSNFVFNILRTVNKNLSKKQLEKLYNKVNLKVSFADTITFSNANKYLQMFFDTLHENKRMADYQIKDSESVSENTYFVFHNGDYLNVSKSDIWFYTSEWQAKEKEVDESLRQGKGRVFDSVEELFNEI